MNWGKGITIFMVAFMSFILYMVITLMTKGNSELESEDYYKKEIKYQNEINAQRNANRKKEKVKITDSQEYLTFTFPGNEKIEEISIEFYRPNNSKNDISFNEQNTSNVLIDKKKLIKGLYIVSISYRVKGAFYMQKEEITI
jgi:hypothetical protein